MRLVLYCSFIVLLLSQHSFTNQYTKKKDEQKEKAKKEASKLLNDSLTEASLDIKERLLRKAYKKDPTNSKIQFSLGKVLCRQKQEEEGIHLLQTAEKDSTLSLRVFNYLANYYYENNKLEKAKRYLLKVLLTKEGNSYLNNFRVAVIYNKARKYRAANYYFIRAFTLRKYADNKEILVNIASNYYTIKDYKRAIFYLKSYPYISKDNQKALRLWISINYYLNNTKALQSSITRYLGVWGNDPWLKELTTSSTRVTIKKP